MAIHLSEQEQAISPSGMARAYRAMSSLSLELTGDRNALDLGTEGSYAKWEVENGTYEVTYKVYSSENDSDAHHAQLSPIATLFITGKMA